MPSIAGLKYEVNKEILRLEDQADPEGAGMRALTRAVEAEDKRFNVWWRRAGRRVGLTRGIFR